MACCYLIRGRKLSWRLIKNQDRNIDPQRYVEELGVIVPPDVNQLKLIVRNICMLRYRYSPNPKNKQFYGLFMQPWQQVPVQTHPIVHRDNASRGPYPNQPVPPAITHSLHNTHPGLLQVFYTSHI